MNRPALLCAAALLLVPCLPGAIEPAQAQEAAAATRFTRDPALFEAKKQQIATAYDQVSPEAGAQVRQFLAQDLLGIVAEPLARMGLDTQDVADMVTLYWIAAHDAVNGIVGQETDPAVARGARQQIGGMTAAMPQLAGMSDAEKQDLADTMLLQGLLIEGRMQSAKAAGPQMLQQMSDQIHREASELTKADLRAMDLTAAGFRPKAGAAAAPVAGAAAPAADAGPAAHAANWDGVDGVYFKVAYITGVGGMMAIDYEPVVLFTDGTYYEVEGPALEDVDLAASRQAEPRNWGRWTRSGNAYTLTDSSGDTGDALTLQDGSFFRAFPADAGGNRLNLKYERLGGGGNTALGGEMMIVSHSQVTFAGDGRYTRGDFGGAMGSGAQSGVAVTVGSDRQMAGVGRYTLDRHTITMTEPDGTTTRQFFAFGSQGTTPRIDADLVFLGDRVFVNMD